MGKPLRSFVLGDFILLGKGFVMGALFSLRVFVPEGNFLSDVFYPGWTSSSVNFCWVRAFLLGATFSLRFFVTEDYFLCGL